MLTARLFHSSCCVSGSGDHGQLGEKLRLSRTGDFVSTAAMQLLRHMYRKMFFSYEGESFSGEKC